MKILNDNFEIGDLVDVTYEERRLPSLALTNITGIIAEFFDFEGGGKGMYIVINKGFSFVPIVELNMITKIKKKTSIESSGK